MAEDNAELPPRKIASVQVRLADETSMLVTDAMLADVVVSEDGDLSVEDTQGGMIFYSPCGHWMWVSIRYKD